MWLVGVCFWVFSGLLVGGWLKWCSLRADFLGLLVCIVFVGLVVVWWLL